MRISDLLIAAVPTALRTKLGWKLLRGASNSYRAMSDVFYAPYCKWMDWRSGLNNAGWVLYGAVRAHRPEVVVEIGSARGRSTTLLSLACVENGVGKVYAIDPNTSNDWSERGTSGDNFAFLQERIRSYGFASVCELMRMPSLEAAKSWTLPIDFLFIDGDHSYEGVKRDYEAFLPHLKEDAIVAFHDSLWEHHKDSPYYTDTMGVPKFISELQQQGQCGVTFATFEGLTLLSPNQSAKTFLPISAADRPRQANATSAVAAQVPAI